MPWGSLFSRAAGQMVRTDPILGVTQHGGQRIFAEIHGIGPQVVEVEKNEGASFLCSGIDEVDFLDGGVVESHVTADVLDVKWLLNGVLHLLDSLAKIGESFLAVDQG